MGAAAGRNRGLGNANEADSLVPMAFHMTQDPISGDVAPAMGQGTGQGCASIGVAYPIQKARSPCGGGQGGAGLGEDGDPMFTVDTGPEHGVVTGAICANGKAAGSATQQDAEAGMLVPFDTTQITSAANRWAPQPGDPCHPLAAEGHPPAVATMAVQEDGQNGVTIRDTAGSLRADAPGSQPCGTLALASMVRRLTPRECERLQGFPDDFTLITYRGKPAADGPRYRALGNSIAVPCLAWIGRRIEIVDAAQRR